MIWWVLSSALLVVIGLVYVIRHESDLCAPTSERYPAEPPQNSVLSDIQSRRAA